MNEREIKAAAYKIVLNILQIINDDGLPVNDNPPEEQGRIYNEVVGIIDQLWTEYHEFDVPGAMDIILPPYER